MKQVWCNCYFLFLLIYDESYFCKVVETFFLATVHHTNVFLGHCWPCIHFNKTESHWFELCIILEPSRGIQHNIVSFWYVIINCISNNTIVIFFRRVIYSVGNMSRNIIRLTYGYFWNHIINIAQYLFILYYQHTRSHCLRYKYNSKWVITD